MMLGSGGTMLLVAHLAIRALVTHPDGLILPTADPAAERSTLDLHQYGVSIVGWFLNGLMFVVAAMLFLLTWGIPFSDQLDAIKALFFGFQIGQFKISLFRILIGIGLFIGVIFVTRLFQRWFDNSFVSSQRLEKGVGNSLHTGIGYFGIGIAALVGLSYAGIDLTQFTVVIGALSLGVGLGLQSIVKQFRFRPDPAR